MRHGIVPITVVAVTIVAGCSGGDQARSAHFAVRDSAGIQIATNSHEPSLLSLEEELRLGQLDGPEPLQFFRVGSVLVSRRGTILVANLGTSEIREFSADGAYIGSFGRAGDGPGEFRRISLLVETGDTTVVVDSGNGRATWIGPEGGVVRSEPLISGAVAIYPLARVEGKWLVTTNYFGDWPYEVGRPRRSEVQFVLMDDLRNDVPAALDDPVTALGPVVVRYEGQRRYGIASQPSMTAASPLWEPMPAHAVDGSGAIHLSEGGRYQIDVFSSAGELVRILRREHRPVPVTDALWDRYFETARAHYDTVSERHPEFELARDAALGREGLPRRESLPPLGRLLVSDDGAVWAERPDLVEDPVSAEWSREGRHDTFWDVFRRTGELVGTVRLPGRFAPRVVTGPEIYGVLRDSLDVEYLVRYRILEW